MSMNTLDNIIKVLGYSNSEFLYHWNDIKTDDTCPDALSLQTYRTLKELDPYAFYCIENKPFVLFFESSLNENQLKAIHKKIWNSQTAVAIFDCGNTINIYNGCSLNQNNEQLYLVESIDAEHVNHSSNFSYWNITNNNFWREFDVKFSEPTLDILMLNNIKFITDYLKGKPCGPFAIQLILRFIFIRFLIDRGVDLDYKGFSNSPWESQQRLLSIIKSRDELFDLFRHLRNKFNGNLFELYYDEKLNLQETELLDDDSLNALSDFMSGELEMDSGQYSLFPMYDFNIIPVELISNIYERFLGVEKQKIDSAFYTPPYLVDYILKQSVKPYLRNNKSFTILDPACGSGIFLVEALRSIIENNLNEGAFFNDNEKLLSLLSDNIYGVDKNQEAVDVAIFSLYLTLLDYKDPKTLREFKLPKLKNINFFVDDFFLPTIDEALKNVKFNFIIGNPPWGRVDNSPHIDYCLENKLPLQNNEIARSFIERTKDFSNEETLCCMVVTSKLFYNSQDSARHFREWLLTHASIGKFIELAAVRELIFKKARGPAAILFYRFRDVGNESNSITHITLKPNMFFKLFNVIVIEKNDINFIPQAVLLNDDWAWKTLVFGTTQDYYNIRNLKKKYKTINNILKENNIIIGRGIETVDGKDNSEHLVGERLIDSKKGISSYRVDLNHSTVFTKKRIHRSRRKELFYPPYTLIKKGFDTKSYKLRSAYSEEKFIYRDAITALKGSEDSKEVLMSLTGVINSSFYAYLNLMLGSSSGIEREQSHAADITEFPAVFNPVLAEKVELIQNTIKNNHEGFFIVENEVDELIEDLDEYILSCFNMQNDVFVNYIINVQIPLLTGDNKIFRKVSIEDLKKYTQIFINYWDDVLDEDTQFVQTTIYPTVMNRFSVVEIKITEEKPLDKINVINEKRMNIDFISKFMLSKFNDLFYQIKDVVNFEEDSFYIIKTNEYKNWHPAMGQIDLAEVINSILSEGRE